MIGSGGAGLQHFPERREQILHPDHENAAARAAGALTARDDGLVTVSLCTDLPPQCSLELPLTDLAAAHRYQAIIDLREPEPLRQCLQCRQAHADTMRLPLDRRAALGEGGLQVLRC